MKGRPSGNPLIVHVSGAEMAEDLASAWGEGARALASAFWPGALTIVAPKAARVPGVVTGGGATVALRCPRHPVALALIEALGGPIVGPSANLSGRLSATRAEHAAAAFAGEDLVVIDGGACRSGIESTVVDPSEDPAVVLRPGSVGIDEIAAVLGRGVVFAGEVEGEVEDGAARSPGRLGAHYRPATPVRVVDRDELAGAGADVAALHWSGEAPGGAGGAVRLPGEARGFGAALYAALHEADAMGLGVIWVESPPGDEKDAVRVAVMERLARAGR